MILYVQKYLFHDCSEMVQTDQYQYLPTQQKIFFQPKGHIQASTLYCYINPCSMTSLSNQVQKYTSILSNLTKSASFGNLLGLQLYHILLSVTNEPATTSDRPIVQLSPTKENNASSDMIVRYTIPSRSCIDGSFPLSGFLAVFDEITTLATGKILL